MTRKMQNIHKRSIDFIISPDRFKTELGRWANQVPLIAFKSIGYGANLIKWYFFK